MSAIQEVRQLFINQTQLQKMLSTNGKMIHNYQVIKMIENKEIPEPKKVGSSKRWSISKICEALDLDINDVHDFLNRDQKMQ